MVWNPNLPNEEETTLVDGYLDHDTRVAEICKDVKDHYDYARSTKVLHTMPGPYSTPGDIPCLDRIVRINRRKRTASVEANVTMESLVDATLQFGLIPCVVACQRSMTVAEAFANTTNESSSFAFGTFDCIVLEIEVILGNGSVVRAGPDNNEELFYGSAGTMNSLGLTTLFKISLQSRGPYVELEFLSSPVSLSNMRKQLETRRTNDLFSPGQSSKLCILSMAIQEAMQEKRKALAAIEQQSSALHMVMTELHNTLALIQKPTSVCDMAIEKVRKARRQQLSPSFNTAVRGTVQDTERALTGIQQTSSLLETAMKHMRIAIAELQKQLAQLNETAKLNQPASDERSADTSVVSMVMANMLWASSDSSADFVEAMIFEDYPGVVVGRTCPTSSGLFFEPSVGKSFAELAKSAMRDGNKNKVSRLVYMKTTSYLFRNDTARPGEKFWSQKNLTDRVPNFQIAVCPDTIEDILERFRLEWNTWPIRICPILSPRRVGCKPSHGIGSTCDFPKDVYFAVGFPHIIETGRVDRILGEVDIECEEKGAKVHSKGFRFMHCHLRGPSLLPWFAHDHKSHRNLREKWHAVVPDVQDQLEPGYQYTSPQCSSATTSIGPPGILSKLGYSKRHSA
jgi:hypothetical protein